VNNGAESHGGERCPANPQPVIALISTTLAPPRREQWIYHNSHQMLQKFFSIIRIYVCKNTKYVRHWR